MEIKVKIGHEAAANMVCIPDDLFTDSSDGDSVSFQGDGKIVEHDGKRYISVSQVNGEDVEELPDTPDQSSNDSQDASEMDSEDALNNYMKNK